MLSDQRFIDIIQHTPLVSIDFIILNDANEVLLGVRNNPPAKHYWFVPGGRIYKNETIVNAKKRIFKTEIGQEYQEGCDQFVGLYDHIYEDNTFKIEGVGTHYVVSGWRVRLSSNEIKPDDQHSSFRWWKVEDALKEPRVHHLTKAYLEDVNNK